MVERYIHRHKGCGGFILPDIENSFTGMLYGYCPKCNKNKLIKSDDYETTVENITLYIIRNKITGEYLLCDNDGESFTIEFESREQADEFATRYNLTDYEVIPNVALYCNNAPVTNGKMVIEKGDE